MTKLAVQENLIPGAAILDQWATVAALGYDGIELRGSGDAAFLERLPALREAVRHGAKFPSICSILPGVYVGSLDVAGRREALARLKVLLSAAAELGARGVVAPASFGIYPIPRTVAWPRTPEEDTKILTDGYAELASHARSAGVEIWIEPLNRYEDHMVNRLEQAVAICEAIGLPSVGLIGDLFHMGIEESDVPLALVSSQRWLRHVHGADNTRFEPGSGQTDFSAIRRSLESIGYAGVVALECRLTGDPLQALRRARATLP